MQSLHTLSNCLLCLFAGLAISMCCDVDALHYNVRLSLICIRNERGNKFIISPTEKACVLPCKIASALFFGVLLL